MDSGLLIGQESLAEGKNRLSVNGYTGGLTNIAVDAVTKLSSPARRCEALLLASVLLLPLQAEGGSPVPGPRQEATARASSPQPYKREPGPFAVETATHDWTDAARGGRVVPVKIYSPRGGGPFPVIVFSHGLGGSRDGYEYLGRHWASHGYAAVHVQHAGSDSKVWQGTLHPLKSMRAAVANPQNALNRPLDVRFVLDRLEAPPYKGRLNLGRVGVAGHSFGAYTALAAAGQAYTGRGDKDKEVTFTDPRVKAAVAMSPPVPRRRKQIDKVYSRIKVPVLHLTGTRDVSPLGGTRATERRIPFDRIAGADQYLLVFAGGDHMVFSGRRHPAGVGVPDKYPLFQDLILMSSTAFWDAYLRGDAAAKAWLANGGLETALGRAGTLEKKLR
jgi:predicted dienelactone hydrolase